MADLADLLEHEDELRGEVMSAVAYPVFVLCFGFVTVAVLLTVVMPKLFSMLTEMATTLPLPTLILLRVSGFIQAYWIPLLSCWPGRWAGIALVFALPGARRSGTAFKLEAAGVGREFIGRRL
jgi:type II secretory pathway component PulF